VIDHLATETGREATSLPHDLVEVVYLRRFCAADEASTSAAIRQAIAQLDEHFPPGKPPGELFVVYRNVRPQTMTLDIAMPLGQTATLTTGDTLQTGKLDLHYSAEAVAQPGFEGLISAIAELAARSSVDEQASHVFFQRFVASQFRPWSGHPLARCMLTVNRTP
jgi:hypothetical protein